MALDLDGFPVEQGAKVNADMTTAEFAQWQREQLSGRQWEEYVLHHAIEAGWMAHHIRPARTAKGWRTPVSGHPGFPDLVLVRGERLLFAELKTGKAKQTPEQNAWAAAIAETGHFVDIWRPREWPAIEEALR